jgi:4-aminobutyrate aminotransferase-like enzyme
MAGEAMRDNATDHLIRYPGHDLLLPNIVRAENCHLYDADDNRYVDLESGVWCTPLGHGHPRVLRAIAEQSARIAHNGYCYSSPVVEEAAKDVLQLLGMDGGRCAFLASGSEAVEYGVRTAQAVVTQPLLLTMSDSYFGAYGSASQTRADEWHVFDWAAGEPVSSIPFDRIGGFLFEPGSSSGLVRFPPPEVIDEIVAAVRENDGLILVNEVTTGIGRTGEWFGFQHYGIAPDIVAMGKGIGNGYPVSVCAVGPGVAERLGGRAIHYSQSHQNDPLGAAVAREVIAVIRDDGLIDRGRRIAAVLSPGLSAIREREARIREIRCRGLMIAVELADDAQTSITTRVHRELVEAGYIVAKRPGINVLRIDPALTIGEEEIRGFLDAFELCVAKAGG